MILSWRFIFFRAISEWSCSAYFKLSGFIKPWMIASRAKKGSISYYAIRAVIFLWTKASAFLCSVIGKNMDSMEEILKEMQAERYKRLIEMILRE